ncbi:MAG: hypothetical protein ACHQJ6_02830 [Candidatus Berkiellales bacterium]
MATSGVDPKKMKRAIDRLITYTVQQKGVKFVVGPGHIKESDIHLINEHLKANRYPELDYDSATGVGYLQSNVSEFLYAESERLQHSVPLTEAQLKAQEKTLDEAFKELTSSLNITESEKTRASRRSHSRPSKVEQKSKSTQIQTITKGINTKLLKDALNALWVSIALYGELGNTFHIDDMTFNQKQFVLINDFLRLNGYSEIKVDSKSNQGSLDDDVTAFLDAQRHALNEPAPSWEPQPLPEDALPRFMSSGALKESSDKKRSVYIGKEKDILSGKAASDHRKKLQEEFFTPREESTAPQIGDSGLASDTIGEELFQAIDNLTSNFTENLVGDHQPFLVGQHDVTQENLSMIKGFLSANGMGNELKMESPLRWMIGKKGKAFLDKAEANYLRRKMSAEEAKRHSTEVQKLLHQSEVAAEPQTDADKIKALFSAASTGTTKEFEDLADEIDDDDIFRAAVSEVAPDNETLLSCGVFSGKVDTLNLVLRLYSLYGNLNEHLRLLSTQLQTNILQMAVLTENPQIVEKVIDLILELDPSGTELGAMVKHQAKNGLNTFDFGFNYPASGLLDMINPKLSKHVEETLKKQDSISSSGALVSPRASTSASAEPTLPRSRASSISSTASRKSATPASSSKSGTASPTIPSQASSSSSRYASPRSSLSSTSTEKEEFNLPMPDVLKTRGSTKGQPAPAVPPAGRAPARPQSAAPAVPPAGRAPASSQTAAPAVPPAGRAPASSQRAAPAIPPAGAAAAPAIPPARQQQPAAPIIQPLVAPEDPTQKAMTTTMAQTHNPAQAVSVAVTTYMITHQNRAPNQGELNTMARQATTDPKERDKLLLIIRERFKKR